MTEFTLTFNEIEREWPVRPGHHAIPLGTSKPNTNNCVADGYVNIWHGGLALARNRMGDLQQPISIDLPDVLPLYPKVAALRFLQGED